MTFTFFTVPFILETPGGPQKRLIIGTIFSKSAFFSLLLFFIKFVLINQVYRFDCMDFLTLKGPIL